MRRLSLFCVGILVLALTGCMDHPHYRDGHSRYGHHGGPVYDGRYEAFSSAD